MNPAQELAGRVRAARLGAGFSQRQLAEIAGVRQQAISRLERGLRANGTYSTLAGIARATGVSISALDPDRRALGHAPSLLARRIDAAGPEGLDRRQLYRASGRHLKTCADLDAALAPLLASGVYEQIRLTRTLVPGQPRTVRIVRRVQPPPPPTSPPGVAASA